MSKTPEGIELIQVMQAGRRRHTPQEKRRLMAKPVALGSSVRLVHTATGSPL